MMNRKLSLALGLAAALLCACGGPKGYTVSGEVPDAQGYAVLRYDTPQGESVRDTAVLKDGKYVFRGSVEDVVMGTIMVYPEGKDPMHAFLYVENAPLTIEGGRAVGGPNNDFMRAMDGAGEGIDRDDPDYPAKVKKALLDFIAGYPDVEAAAFMYYNFSRDASYEDLEAGYNAFTDRVKNCYLAERLREELVSRKAIQPGLEAPDFTLLDREGKEISLSSLRGKPVLVDFWASWCKPCRASMPGLKALYERFHAKGFEILGVSVDSGPEPWKQAIVEDETPWIHVLDESQGKNRPTKAAQLYGVRAVPSYFLIDAEGKLIGKMDHDTLEPALASLLD